MSFAEYFLNCFPKYIKKTIICLAKFLYFLEVVACIGGVAAALLGWLVFDNETAIAIGAASFVVSVLAIIPVLAIYEPADLTDFQEQLRELLDKEKQSNEGRFKLTQRETAKLAKLKERQKKIEEAAAKNNGNKENGTCGCVISMIFWPIILAIFGGIVGRCVAAVMLIAAVLMGVKYAKAHGNDTVEEKAQAAAQAHARALAQVLAQSRVEPTQGVAIPQRQEQHNEQNNAAPQSSCDDDMQY